MARRYAFVLLSLLLAAESYAADQPRYSVFDWGSLKGDVYLVPSAIDDRAEVTGIAHTATLKQDGSYTARAFVSAPDRKFQLPIPQTVEESAGAGINNSGDVVGWMKGPESGQRPALWKANRRGNPMFLSELVGVAKAINGNGIVVGEVIQKGLSWQAFIWKDGQMTMIAPSKGTTSFAAGINDFGMVVGYLSSEAGKQSAYTFHNQALTVLPGLSSNNSAAQAVNNWGRVVGRSITVTGQSHAVLWQDGKVTDLGIIAGKGTSAVGINDAGQVIGNTVEAPNIPGTPFVWENGAMKSLNDLIPANSGWKLLEVRDINNKGEIVGTGEHQGNKRIFVLRPMGK